MNPLVCSRLASGWKSTSDVLPNETRARDHQTTRAGLSRRSEERFVAPALSSGSLDASAPHRKAPRSRKSQLLIEEERLLQSNRERRHGIIPRLRRASRRPRESARDPDETLTEQGLVSELRGARRSGSEQAGGSPEPLMTSAGDRQGLTTSLMRRSKSIAQLLVETPRGAHPLTEYLRGGPLSLMSPPERHRAPKSRMVQLGQ